VAASRHSVVEGLALIRRHVRLIAPDVLATHDALGAITAAPILAKRTVPSFRAAAMDGYALSSDDSVFATSTVPVALPLAGGHFPGSPPTSHIAGFASIIGTGAPLPDGADSIVLLELAERRSGRGGSEVLIRGPVRAGMNVRQIGEDMVVGHNVMDAGRMITPDALAGLTAYGISELPVRRAPELALIVTGSELAPTSEALGPTHIVDSNGPMIAAYAATMGSKVLSLGIVPDRLDALGEALDRATSSNAGIIVTTGGAAQGERDLVRVALEQRGAQIIFHGLAMRPGKPVLFAILPDGRPFFGLPGNPVSASVAMRFLVAQGVRAMLGLPDEIGFACSHDAPGRDGVTLFLRGRRRSHADGRLTVDLESDQRSHILSSLIAADHWLVVDRLQGETRYSAYPKQLIL
jgi:molybdopterin molybdotransferase